MSAEEIKLNIPQAQEMAKTFRDSATRIEELSQEMKGISTMLQEGGLVGRGGAAFSEAIEQKLCPALTRFTAKLNEMNDDVNEAIKAMEEADEESAGLMGD